MTTDASEFLGELNAGIYGDLVGHLITDCAARTLEHRENSEITLKFKLSPLGSGTQLKVEHSAEFKAPTKDGKKSEKSTTSTPMYQNDDGSVTLFPKNQGQLFDSPVKKEKV